MTEQKSPSEPVFSIIKMPRKNMDFFRTGQLYKLKFNKPYEYRIRYSIIETKQLDCLKEVNKTKKRPFTFDGISEFLTKKYNVNYAIERSADLYNSYVLNDTFVCLENNATILRNFPTTIDNRRLSACIFKQVPVFMFHSIKNNNPIIGSIQIDLNDQNLEELFAHNVNEATTPDNLIYIENLFEEINE